MKTESPIVRFLIVMASFVIVVAGMRTAEPLLVPFLLSLFIAVLCSPPLIWMKSKGIPNSVAILSVIASVIVVGFLVGAVVGSSITSFKEDLPQYQMRLTELSASLFIKLNELGIQVDLTQTFLRRRGVWR